MRLLYISTSLVPSIKANSIHVMKMCNAFQNNKVDITLICKKGDIIEDNVYNFYGLNNNFNIIYVSKSKFGIVMEIYKILILCKKYDYIYTRWSLGAFISSVIMKQSTIIEFHSFPYGRINRLFTKLIKKSSHIILNVFITRSLHECYIKNKLINQNTNSVVCPDGADIQKNYNLCNMKPTKNIECCYVGSFYEGKGIETVVLISNYLPFYKFHIIGGTKLEIAKMKSKSMNDNITWYGHLNQNRIIEVVKKCQIGLLPNKTKVIIDKNKDIGQWTSPLKMFEYMAQGKCIVASDIKVLKEILTNNENALLVDEDDIDEWVETIKMLNNHRDLLLRISTRAYNDIKNMYSWDKRVKYLIGIISNE